MAEPSDASAIRTAGLVLSGIGCLAMIIITGWNASTDYPALDSLDSISGTVSVAEVKTISTRTAIEKWIVIEVDSAPGSVAGRERWVFPSFEERIAKSATAVPPGTRVTGRAKNEPELLRWSEEPVRVIWSLSDEAGELVSYSEVIGVEQEEHHQSPVAGLMMIAMGVFLIVGSRMRLGAS